jgi:uncharacterized protein (DUF1810 family)
MPTANGKPGQADPLNLGRFVNAQEGIYPQALAELKSGQKRSHWMWFVFPQIDGLGYSSTARHYAIRSETEARRYLDHPVLGKRLVECAETLLALAGRSASDIFGYPDDLKLRSCMTLFAYVSSPGSVFARVLDKYYGGIGDERTLAILGELSHGGSVDTHQA